MNKSFIEQGLLFLILIFISSCSTLKKAKLSPDEVSLNHNNLFLINGTYKRYANKDSSREKDIFWDFDITGYNKGDRVNLFVINDRHIKVTLLDSLDTIKTKNFKGKIKDGHFVFKRKVIVYPLIIANVYKDTKMRIGILANGNLAIDNVNLTYGHITIFPLIDKGKIYESEHQRIELKTN